MLFFKTEAGDLLSELHIEWALIHMHMAVVLILRGHQVAFH